MNNQENNKKKILLTYLIAVICLLVITAVTITVIFTVGKSTPDEVTNTIQTPNENLTDPDEDEQPTINEDKTTPDNEDNTQVSVEEGASLPVKEANILNSHAVFYYDKTLDRYCTHQGIDFVGEAGDEVYAILDGTVSDIVTDDTLYGNYLTLTHDDGMTTIYRYIDIDEGLEVGRKITKGEKIGTIATACGNEYADGAHLHFELYSDGKISDPATILDFDEK
jgi:murein DD-endopeptidase MepM/ murein hydrolase activator NlpD